MRLKFWNYHLFLMILPALFVVLAVASFALPAEQALTPMNFRAPTFPLFFFNDTATT